MKVFWRYVFPFLFGLTIYATIRVVTDTTNGEKFWTRPWEKNAIEIVVVTIMAYVIERGMHYFIQRFKHKRNQFSAGTVLKEFGELSLISIAIINPVLFFIHYLIKDPVKWNDFAIANIVVILYMLLYYAIARGNTLIKDYIEQKVQLEKVKTDQLQTELKFLKAQYHPHFLFNALNTIYFQMDDNVAAAKKSIEKFSELLRYQLYDQQQTVPVSQELHYLNNFIDLQKVRSSEKLHLQVELDNNLNGYQVYPLLFLPLVENAFKYVGGDYYLSITAKQEGNSIRFKVINSIPPVMPSSKASGIGLENLRRRLELLYPGKHKLSTSVANNTFTAELNLELN